MQTLLIIGFGISTCLLIVIASITPRRSALSRFELERRRDKGNKTASEELKREVLLDDVLSIQKVIEALLLVGVVLLSLIAFGGITGTLVAILVALAYHRAAQLEVIHATVERVYDRCDAPVMQFAEHHPQLGSAVRCVTVNENATEISSREEFEHLVDESGTILTSDEKKLILNGLHFNEKTVEQIMTPRGVVDVVSADELVGPLTLDALHKTGHSRFPVIDGDIDHVIGVLHLRELLTIDSHASSETAKQLMEKKVYYINQDQTLDHALAAFLKTRHHLFIVVNSYRETAGTVTLEDVMEALLGREIVDEFDVHDDLRAVANRSAKTNNNSPNATNV